MSQGGETVGFTNDGKVFLTATGVTEEGRPAQITFMWEPRQARQIADWLNNAAKHVDHPLVIPARLG